MGCSHETVFRELMTEAGKHDISLMKYFKELLCNITGLNNVLCLVVMPPICRVVLDSWK